MGGRGGGGLFLSMLNGTEAQQTLGKSADICSQLQHHRGGGGGVKDLAELKMGIQDGRFYYTDAAPSGPDALTLPLPLHSEPAGGGGYAPQPARLYAQSLGGCPYGGVRSPPRSGAAQGFIPPPGDKDLYPPCADGFPGGFQHGYQRPPLYPLPGLQVCGKTQALLNNFPLWAKFHKFQTEMIITKQGR